MRIGEIDVSSSLSPLSPADQIDGELGQSLASRSLTVVAPAAEPSGHRADFRYAPFLAQLVATKDGHPQTRERRRAEPREALAAYRSVASKS